jgi:hypothetical protein
MQTARALYPLDTILEKDEEWEPIPDDEDDYKEYPMIFHLELGVRVRTKQTEDEESDGDSEADCVCLGEFIPMCL